MCDLNQSVDPPANEFPLRLKTMEVNKLTTNNIIDPRGVDNILRIK